MNSTINLDTKRCCKCEKVKPLTLEFWYKSKTNKDNFYSICKFCSYKSIKEKRKQIHKINKENLLKGKLENPEIKKKCCRCKELKPLTFEFWNKEMVSKDGFTARCSKCDEKRFAEYYNREKESIGKRHKEVPSYVLRHVRDMARKRNLKFEIDLEYYEKNLFKKPCYYCGGKTKGWLDRKDNNKNIGYTIDNVVSCCENCNKAKGILTVNEFLAHVLKTAEYIKKEHKEKI